MLDPQDRVLFTEALRPPKGYELSWAIGTTYTLDLVAAVAAPLAFALFDWQQDDASHGGPGAIPLLEDCIHKSPDSAEFHYHFGMVLLASGEKSKGKDQIETALRMKLGNDDAQQARQVIAQVN